MPFAPYGRAMLDARSLCGSWASCII